MIPMSDVTSRKRFETIEKVPPAIILGRSGRLARRSASKGDNA
jgi:hypothetical protein